MNDYKRLTEKDIDGKYSVFDDECKHPFESLQNAVDRLGELEDKIEQQEVVSLNSVAKLLNNWFDSPCAYGLNNEFVAE